ncbi:MAG: hypothetical protein V1908_02735 [Candidatus Peregrinibacteria bacterium]
MLSQTYKTFIVIIVTAIVVGGGVYLWQHRPLQKTIVEQNSQWQVVTDPQIGYTIQYPSGWIKADLSSGFAVSPGGGLGMSLQYYDKAEKTQEDLIGQIGFTAGTERSESRNNIELNGIKAIKISVTTTPPTDPTTAIVFEAYGKIFVLQTSYNPEEFETFYKSFRLLN